MSQNVHHMLTIINFRSDLIFQFSTFSSCCIYYYVSYFCMLWCYVTGVASIGPVGPGLHFISKNEKNKTSKLVIKNEGLGRVGSTIGSTTSRRASECTIKLHCFQKILCKSKCRIKACHIARVSVLVFIFTTVPNCFK